MQWRKSFGVRTPLDFGPVVSRPIWTPQDFYINVCKAVVKSNKETHIMCKITIRGKPIFSDSKSLLSASQSEGKRL